MGKDNFLISAEWGEMFKALPNDKAGELIKAIYEVRENPDYQIEDPVLSAIFVMIKKYITDNEHKYQEKCRKMAENGKTKKQNKSIASNCSQLQTEESKREQIESDKSLSLSLSLSVKEIVDYLNTKTGKSYKATTKATREHISARLAEGFTVDDFKRVIDYKTEKWLNDPKMSEYLRPETLFCSKFEGYLQSAPRPKVAILKPKPPDSEPEMTDEEWAAMYEPGGKMYVGDS